MARPFDPAIVPNRMIPLIQAIEQLWEPMNVYLSAVELFPGQRSVGLIG
ncbi:hypothetical protein [Phormidesmis priestleyi]